MARNLEKEIDALFRAKLEQLPAWHKTTSRPGDEVLSFKDGLDLLYGMIRNHREIILRLAREIDDFAGSQNPDSQTARITYRLCVRCV